MVVRTFSGKMFNLADPDDNQIEIEDIAHALSMICRFGGHSREFYSVAQHSVYVSQMVDTELELAGLLHDAAEAYIGDLVTPIKQKMAGFQDVERRVAEAIGRQFEVKHLADLHPEIKRADAEILSWEARHLMGVDACKEWGTATPRQMLDVQTLVPWSQADAEKAFLTRYYDLNGDYYRSLLMAGGSFISQ